jgi:TRAP-type uncharacterized transport system substrate-binding protein
MTKEQIITNLKTEFPTLKKTFDNVESDMTLEEYEAQIETWADLEVTRLAAEESAETNAAAKQALLDRLGLTAEEAKLLLS